MGNYDIHNGLIYSIQRYCIHDGHGIRTNIFFKGCHLRCPWCSNPESQKAQCEISFASHKCLYCGLCFSKCQNEALSKNGSFRILKSKCDLCGECVRYCPRECYKIFGKTVTVPELIDEIMKDWIYYRKTGGGVTLTGGEPTDQYPFVLELLKACKKSGIDTAMETHGFGKPGIYCALAPYVDHFLIDIKNMDTKKCSEVTGSPIDISEADNIRMLAVECGKCVSIRIPIIPGFNDDVENITRLADFALEINKSGNLYKINLLPYHNLGESKYEALGIRYRMEGIKSLADETVVPLRDFLIEKGLPAIIGG